MCVNRRLRLSNSVIGDCVRELRNLFVNEGVWELGIMSL